MADQTHEPAYRPGVAPVGRSVPPAEPTATLFEPPRWPAPRPPLRQLKRGGEWSTIGALFAFICWGLWAIAERPTNLAGPALAFVLILVVAGGVFALCRLLGRVVLERSFGRRRRSAWPSHLVTGLFLAAAGVEYLRRTGWVVEGLTWLRGL